MFRLVWLRGGAATFTEPFWGPRERPTCNFSHRFMDPDPPSAMHHQTKALQAYLELT
jgi:hypothetical protein